MRAVIPGAFGMALLALLVAYVLLRKRSSSITNIEEAAGPGRHYAVIEAIALLDNRFHQREMGKQEYLQRRSELKGQILGPSSHFPIAAAPVTHPLGSEGMRKESALETSGMSWRRQPRSIVFIGLVTLLPLLLGFVVGIVPGLLSGLVGWHKEVALVLPIIWAIGYILQRAKGFRDVSIVTYSIAILGGFGVGISVWVFGSVSS